MNPTDLRAFVDRWQALGEHAPSASRQETRTWIVDPLLATLGWDIRAQPSRHDLLVGDCHLEYALFVASTPALFVAVEPYGEGLEAERADGIQAAMAETGVDRAIYTDGDTVALVAGEDHLECRLEDLPKHADALSHFSKAGLERRLEAHSRSVAARRLALERDSLADTITDELAAVAGEDHCEEFRRATEEFLDRLEGALSGSVADPVEDGLEGDTPETGESDEIASTSEPSGGDEETNGTDGDGEYVVRFFANRGSIGAVGHSSPEGALVEATQYLFERGLTGVRTPWPDEGPTVLNDSPTIADGSRMDQFRKLPNGCYLNTAGDPDELASRVVAMAERAGLRAMVTGDWERRTS
ncbi:hypothetical protein ACYJ1Y_05320 [Natrialbaceae archaeon A-gly3]